MIPVDIHDWPRWLLETLHVDPTRIPEGADAWISFERFPESGFGLLAVLAIVAGCVYVGATYRREASLPLLRKIIFATLRCLVLLTIALALFLPVLEVSVEREQKATTLVFIDDSLSFGISDRYPSDPERRAGLAKVLGIPAPEVGAMTRAAIAERLLADEDARLLERLAETNLLKVYTFSEKPVAVAADDPKPPSEPTPESGSADGPPPPPPPRVPRPKISPLGTVTDLGLAVRSTVEGLGGAPIAAVVLITDGRVTAGEDATSLGLFLAERRVPVYSIGIGDPTPTKNIRVMAMFAPDRVFVDDPITVDVRVDHRGFAGETVPVELVHAGTAVENGGATEEVLQTVNVTFTEGRETTARFETKLGRIGRHRLLARVAPIEGETFENDNERMARVEVVEQATRVLLIAGAPSNEFRMLRNLLRRDRRVHLSAWLMSADPDAPQEGNSVLEKLPSTPKELFDYDVVILNDPNPRGFPPRYAELLETFVEKHKGGIAFVAGEKYTGRLLGASDMSPLRAILAVEADMPRLQDEYARGRFHTELWPVLPTSYALTVPATRLASDPDRNRERWAELAGVYWSLPVKRPKPGARVLLEHPNPRYRSGDVRRPLLAYQLYGGGRSLFLGFDETWRWRALSEEIYDQFWMQIVRTLTEGRLLGDRRKLVRTDRESYDLGDVVRINAMVQDENYQPSTAPSVDIEISSKRPNGESGVEIVTLEKDPKHEGEYAGIYVPREVGALTLKMAGGSPTTVSVSVPDLEYQDPRLDETTLRDLAKLTGGELVPIASFAEIPDKIPNRGQKVITADEPQPIWDSALTLGIVVFLLSLEWVLRKLSRLP